MSGRHNALTASPTWKKPPAPIFFLEGYWNLESVWTGWRTKSLPPYSESNCSFSVVQPGALQFFFSRVPQSQYKTCTPTTIYCKYKCILSGYWSSGMFRWSVGLKSSDLPTSGTAMLWKLQISLLLLFWLHRIRRRRRICVFNWKLVYFVHIINVFSTFQHI